MTDAASAPSQPPPRVLLVEDAPDVLRLHAAYLRSGGLSVSTAQSAAEALDVARREPPDLLLLDYMMPHMTGVELLRAIRRDPSLADLSALFLTALSDGAHVEQAFDAGASDYLTKPVNRRILLSRVNALLQARRDRARVAEAGAALRERDSLREEMVEAQRLQQGLIPHVPVRWGRSRPWVITGGVVPCSSVGGDFFDVVVSDAAATLIVVDVSGHGAAAGIVASGVRSCFRLLKDEPELPRIVAKIHEHLSESGDHYACVALVRVHDDDRVQVLNAGLPPIAVLRPGEDVELLAATATPPGLFAGPAGQVVELRAEPDLALMIVSDGVTEPMGSAHDTLLAAKWLGLLGGARPDAEALRSRAAALPARDDGPRPDDATVVVLHRDGAAT